VAKTALRASTSALETENGFAAREGRPREAVVRSWDLQQYLGGGEYDSVSQLISKSLVSSTEDNKKGDSNGVSAKPGRPFLPRSNGAGKNGEYDTKNGAEVTTDSSGDVLFLFCSPHLSRTDCLQLIFLQFILLVS
jgi:hypothetical protein